MNPDRNHIKGNGMLKIHNQLFFITQHSFQSNYTQTISAEVKSKPNTKHSSLNYKCRKRRRDTHKLRDRCCRSDRSGRDKRRWRSSRGLGPWADRRRCRGPTEAHLRSIRGETRECQVA